MHSKTQTSQSKCPLFIGLFIFSTGNWTAALKHLKLQTKSNPTILKFYDVWLVHFPRRRPQTWSHDFERAKAMAPKTLLFYVTRRLLPNDR